MPDGRRAPTASRRSRCASSTSTAPRQALSNPYTGVLAIFASRLLNGNRAADLRGRPAAARLRQRPRRRRAPAGSRSSATRRAGGVLNIGSGAAVTVREIAARMARGARPPGPRAGDHRQVPRRRHPPLLRRHPLARAACSATSRRSTLEDGLAELADWLARPGGRSTASTRGARGARRAGADAYERRRTDGPVARSPAAPASSAPTSRIASLRDGRARASSSTTSRAPGVERNLALAARRPRRPRRRRDRATCATRARVRRRGARASTRCSTSPRRWR